MAPGGVPEAATAAGQCSQLETSQAVVCTDFIAETLLPTSSGKYRLRGYRHSVHLVSALPLVRTKTERSLERPLAQS